MKILNLKFKVIGASFCTLVMLGCSVSYKASEMKADGGFYGYDPSFRDQGNNNKENDNRHLP